MIRALAGQSAIYAAATAVARGAQVVMLLIIPLILTPSDYGALQMILTVGILANLIVPLEVTQGLARYFPQASPADQKRYASSAFWFTLVMLALFVALSLPSAEAFCETLLGDLVFLQALRAGLVFAALTSVIYFMQSQCRWQFDTTGYVLISILYAFGTLAGGVLFGLLISPAIDGVILGQALGAVPAVLVGLLRLRAVIAPVVDFAKLKEMLVLSLPLVPAQLALFATLYGSRLILNDLAPLREVGLFTYAGQIAAVSILAVFGVNAALTPLIMAHHHEPDTPRILARIFEIFCAAAVLLCLALGLLADEVIYFLGDPAYAESAPLVMIMAPGVLVAQMYIFAPGFIIAKKTVYQLVVSFVSGAVAIAANYLLISLSGIYGAAWASLLSSLVFIGLWFALSQRLYRLPIRWAPIAAMIACAVALALVGWTQLLPNPLLEALLDAALIGLAGLICIWTRVVPPTYIARGAAAVGARLRAQGQS